MFIQFINFMGDEDDYRECNLVGPFPDPAARVQELNRLVYLPLGGDELHGGYSFVLWPTDEGRPTDARVVAPKVVAGATTIREFFNRFFNLGLSGVLLSDDPPGSDLVPGQPTIPI